MKVKTIILYFVIGFSIIGCKSSKSVVTTILAKEIAFELNKSNQDIIKTADQYLSIVPMPITQFSCVRSAGGIHDYYSEGDYWWPDTLNIDGPYIRRDGLTNPNNFVEHRLAMRNLNKWVSILVEAYIITNNEKYAIAAMNHLQKFFLDKETLMNPNLLYGQAIKGLYTGRGIGIVDTIHLIEVAKSIMRLNEKGQIPRDKFVAFQKWFEDYSNWMTTHQYGLDEKNNGNNHSTWWATQLAAFARLTNNRSHMNEARATFKTLLAKQMEVDGSFPDELSRTKPYNYSLFNLEGFAILCESASDREHDLWNEVGPKGTIKKAFEFMSPYIYDKASWTKKPDIQHFEEIPVKTPGLLMAAVVYDDRNIFDAWKKAKNTKTSEEVERNFPLWTYKLWLKI
jgi:hypothetical protein